MSFQTAFKSRSTVSPSQKLGQRVPCGWSGHRMLSCQTWSVFSVPRSWWCQRIVGGNGLCPDWLMSQCPWCVTWTGRYAPYTSSELICTGSDSELATSVGQPVPGWHGRPMVTGPERVVQQHSGLAVVGRRLTTEVLQVVSYGSPLQSTATTRWFITSDVTWRLSCLRRRRWKKQSAGDSVDMLLHYQLTAQ